MKNMLKKAVVSRNKLLGRRTLSAVAIILMLTAVVMSLSLTLNQNATTVNAQTSVPSDLLQYEWPQATADASRSFASAGPGPNSFNIKWKARIPGVISQPIAFNGKVFVQDNSVYFGKGKTTYCLDAFTGEILWKVNAVGSIVKLDDNYMLIGNDAYKIADGTLAWTAPPGFMLDLKFGGVIFLNGLTQLDGVGYDPKTKILFTGGLASSTTQAWYFPDASKPPTLLWSRSEQPDFGRYGVERAKVYGDGILVLTTGYQYLLGVNATTGETIWATPTKISQWIYGMSVHAGVIGFGGLDGNFYGWNLTTGELMWTYNPGTYYNQWASAVAAAYGMFYEHNQDGYIYAINAKTGDLVWRAKGPGVAYSNILTIAGGKVYVQMGENQYIDFATGEPGQSEFDCFDAYTGELIWSAPFENGAPFNSQCNAYGNLYVVPTISSYHPGEFIYSYSRPDGGLTSGDGGLGEIWCISDTSQDWSMLFSDPQHSGYGNGPTKLKLKWTATTGGGIVSSPTLVNGVAYIGSYDGNIYAFNANNGQKLWNYSIGKIGFSSTVAVVNGKLYTGPDDGNVYCLDATSGTKLWQASAGGVPSSTSPTVAKNKVYVSGGDGKLYCFSASDGALLWKFNTGGTFSTSPLVVGDAVFIPASKAPGGILFKLDANNGTQIFNVTIPGYLSSPGVSASAVYGEGMVFVRTTYRYNYAVNATTGEIVWTVESRYNPGTPEQYTAVTQVCAMLYQYGRVYFNDFYGITCVNAFNGSELWHTWLSRENLAQGLSYSYGKIYTVNEAGVLYVLDALTGKKLSYYEFPGGGAQLHSMPVPYNGSLYVGSLDWNLYCFEEYEAPKPVSTGITLSLSTNSIEIGKSVVVTGKVSPVQGPVQVTVTFDKPDSTYLDMPVTTDGNGAFTVIYKPDIAGDWRVVAWWNGDASHTSAYSESLSLTVSEPEPPPVPAVKTDIDQAIANLTPLLLGITVAVAVAIIIGVVNLVIMVRKMRK
jgi:outer membrane protein assembly factor BamB